MFCMNCGKELPDEAKFCMSCGTRVGTTGDSTYISVDCAKGFKRGKLELRREKLVFVSNKGAETIYSFQDISEIHMENAIIYLTKKGAAKEEIYTLTDPHTNLHKISEIMENVKKGVYPEVEN